MKADRTATVTVITLQTKSGTRSHVVLKDSSKLKEVVDHYKQMYGPIRAEWTTGELLEWYAPSDGCPGVTPSAILRALGEMSREEERGFKDILWGTGLFDTDDDD